MIFYRRAIRPVLRKAYYFFAEGFSFLLGLLFFWHKRKMQQEFLPSKILVIKIERIGDLVLSMPTARILKNNYPDSKVTLLVSFGMEDLVCADPCLDNIIVYEPQGKHKGLFGKIKLIKELRSEDFDLVLDLTTRDFFTLPAALTFFSGAKLTVGLDNLGRGFLFNIRVKPQKEPRYYCREVADILSPLGIIPLDKELIPKIYILEKKAGLLEQRFKDLGINKNNRLVIIHCGGYYSQQRWKPKGFAAVADHLSAKYSLLVFFVGSGQDQQSVEDILSLCLDKKNKFNLAGKLRLGEMAALMARASIFVGSSSGPSHLAYALDVPTVTILGSTVARRWVNPGPKNIALQADLDCVPCYGVCQKEEVECINVIDQEQVIRAADSLINNFVR
jgi:ADP-heptose:LPS heptosyltransferase